MTYDNSIFSYNKLLLTTYASICISVYLYIFKKKIVGFSILALVIMFGILSSDKNPILMGLIALIPSMESLIIKYRILLFKNKLYITIILILIAILIILLVPIFSVYRGGVDIFNTDLKEIYYFSFTKIDPTGPFLSIAQTIKNKALFNLDFTYIKELLVVIPKMLFPNRPMSLADQFAQEMMLNWSSGMGLGYSLMAEAINSFGYFGCIVHYFIIGLIWGMSWRFIGNFINNTIYINIFYKIVGFNILIIMHRGGFIQIIKTLIHSFFPLFMALFFIYISNTIFKKNSKFNTAAYKL